jgi:hypothetical protein
MQSTDANHYEIQNQITLLVILLCALCNLPAPFVYLIEASLKFLA